MYIVKANKQARLSQEMASCHLDQGKGKTTNPGEDEIDR